MRKRTEEAWKRCPKCGKIENQIKAGYNASGSQRCKCKETLDTLRAAGLKLAIGSSSKNTQFILGQLGLGSYFDAVSDGNNIIRSKPDPEVFLKAAMLGLDPSVCLVVEDAVSGAQAGHAGGFDVACVGDASQASAGDYNLTCFGALREVAAH